MKSSIALLIIAFLVVVIQAFFRVTGYGSGDITTEIVIIICASHICRVMENKS